MTKHLFTLVLLAVLGVPLGLYIAGVRLRQVNDNQCVTEGPPVWGTVLAKLSEDRPNTVDDKLYWLSVDIDGTATWVPVAKRTYENIGIGWEFSIWARERLPSPATMN